MNETELEYTSSVAVGVTAEETERAPVTRAVPWIVAPLVPTVTPPLATDVPPVATYKVPAPAVTSPLVSTCAGKEGFRGAERRFPPRVPPYLKRCR